MKWLEMIRVQAAGGQGKGLEERISALHDEVRKGPGTNGLVEWMHLQQASVPGSFAIYLIWEAERPDAQGSPLGLNLTEALRAFGLVNHSVWISPILGYYF